MSGVLPFRREKKDNKKLLICRLCEKEITTENKKCTCLERNEHFNGREVQRILQNDYHDEEKSKHIHEILQLERQPEKLTKFISRIYDVVETTRLSDDLSPKTFKKLKENAINEICMNLEHFSIDEEDTP
jgi:hypothetical protein